MNIGVVTNFQKQLELFGKERIIVFEVEPEERKRFDERAAPDDDFRSAVRKKIEERRRQGGEKQSERAKLGEGADGLGRGRRGDGAGESEWGCARGRRGEDRSPGADDELTSMVAGEERNSQAQRVSE